jgi:DNA-binding NarL/FixJ family response regulator
MDPATTTRIFARMRAFERKVEEDAFHGLSERELEVLYEVSLGKTNAEIAQSLNLGEKTARNYVSAILEKLQFSNRIELATYAVKYNLSERMK